MKVNEIYNKLENLLYSDSTRNTRLAQSITEWLGDNTEYEEIIEHGYYTKFNGYDIFLVGANEDEKMKHLVEVYHHETYPTVIFIVPSWYDEFTIHEKTEFFAYFAVQFIMNVCGNNFIVPNNHIYFYKLLPFLLSAQLLICNELSGYSCNEEYFKIKDELGFDIISSLIETESLYKSKLLLSPEAFNDMMKEFENDNPKEIQVPYYIYNQCIDCQHETLKIITYNGNYIDYNKILEKYKKGYTVNITEPIKEFVCSECNRLYEVDWADRNFPIPLLIFDKYQRFINTFIR